MIHTLPVIGREATGDDARWTTAEQPWACRSPDLQDLLDLPGVQGLSDLPGLSVSLAHPARLDEVIGALTVGVVVHDADGHVVAANEMARSMLTGLPTTVLDNAVAALGRAPGGPRSFTLSTPDRTAARASCWPPRYRTRQPGPWSPPCAT